MKNWDFDNFMEALGFESGPYLQAGEARPVSMSTAAATPTNFIPTPSGVSKPTVRDLLMVISPPLSGEARELGLKMIAAMKMPSHQIRHLELASVDTASVDAETLARACVCILLGHFAESEDWSKVSVFRTHSPEECLSDPALKRPVWDTMQLAMRQYTDAQGSFR